MGHPKKKAAAKARHAAPPQEADGREPPNEDFEAFLHRTNAQLDQAALRGGAQVAALHIFDSEAMYEEVFQLKKASYDVMVREQAENAATLAKFRATTPPQADIAGYLAHMKNMVMQ